MEKTCSKCKTSKPLDDFGRDSGTKDGKFYWCKECVKLHSRLYYHSNKEICRAKSLEIYYRNSSDPSFRERRNARQREYSKEYVTRPETRKKAAGWRRKYMQKPSSRISRRMGFQIWNSLRSTIGGYGKDGRHWEELVCFTTEELMAHLESRFEAGMTWDNYGGDGWQLDHIKPRSWFDIQKAGDDAFMECWALENLQPMWRRDNAKKGNRFAGGCVTQVS